MEIAGGAGEIARHGFADGDGGVEELLLAGGAPDGEQAADDDAAIEEIGEGGGLDFERHGLRRGVPGAGEEAGGGEGAVEIAGVVGDGVQIDECADGVAGDLGGGGKIAAGIHQVVAGYAAVRLLNSGVEEPLSGTRELWGQAASLTSRRRRPR